MVKKYRSQKDNRKLFYHQSPKRQEQEVFFFDSFCLIPEISLSIERKVPKRKQQVVSSFRKCPQNCKGPFFIPLTLANFKGQYFFLFLFLFF